MATKVSITQLNKAATEKPFVLGSTSFFSEGGSEFSEVGSGSELKASPFFGSENGKKNGGGGGAPSLDTNAPSSNSDTIHEWGKKQKRGYHRVQSCLTYWLENGFQVLWIMLSTANGGDPSKLAYHHQRLRQRVESRLGYRGLQHFQVRTSEGNGVLHIFWAWKPECGFRQRSFYVAQGWLSKQWAQLHGAPIVWVSRVRSGRISRNKVSRYCMSQYVSGQAGYEYMSWSWGRTFGFPLVACWRAFKKLWSRANGNGRREALYRFWGSFLSGGGLVFSGKFLDMAMVREAYAEWGSVLWENL